MRNIFVSVILFLTILLQSNCAEGEEVNFSLTPLEIKKVQIPDGKFKPGQTYNLGVFFIKPGDCYLFTDFAVRMLSETESRVVAIATVTKKSCEEEETLRGKVFNFVVKNNKDHKFKFWSGKDASGKDTYIEVDIPVEKS